MVRKGDSSPLNLLDCTSFPVTLIKVSILGARNKTQVAARDIGEEGDERGGEDSISSRHLIIHVVHSCV